ncbi:hypothetical protein G6F60_014713 [Rhizopus arrhizus]|nr:hypothetical protein G6F60_014713 [Rhizopus arrhizus]
MHDMHDKIAVQQWAGDQVAGRFIAVSRSVAGVNDRVHGSSWVRGFFTDWQLAAAFRRGNSRLAPMDAANTRPTTPSDQCTGTWIPCAASILPPMTISTIASPYFR